MFEKLFKTIGQVVVWLIILILVAGLAMWGIGDILTSSGKKVVAEVGNQKIYQTQIDAQVAKAQQKLGTRQLPEEMMAEFVEYIKQSSLTQEINKKLIELKAKELNLELDGKQIIRKDFLEGSGYDRDQLKRFIRSQGGEDYFLNKTMNEKKITFVESIFSSIPLIDQPSIESLHKLKKQVRDLTVIQLKIGDLSDVEEPKEGEIINYYNNNKNNFLASEFRSFSYVVLNKSIIREDDIKKDEDLVADILYETSGELLDKLAEGLTLEEASTALDIKEVKKISAISAAGLSEDGDVVDDLPKIKGFIPAGFNTEEGEISELLESNSGDEYVLIRVDSIAPQRIKALDEVRPVVINSWKKDKKLEKLLETAENIKKDAEAGKSFKELKKQYKFEHKIFKSVDRGSNKLPTAIIDEAFNLKLNEITNVSKDENGNLILALVTKIKAPKEIDPYEVLETKDVIEQELFQEIMFQYLEYLKTKYKVKINI